MPASQQGTALARDVRGHGEPIVLLGHGFGHDRSVWAGLAQRLAKRATTLAYDARGFGESERMLADSERWTMQVAVDDLEAITTSFAPSPVVVVGHSFQASAALALAARGVPNLAAAVAIGGAARWVSGDDYPLGADPAQAGPLVAMLAADYTASIERLAPAAYFNEPDRDLAAPWIAATITIAEAAPNPAVLAGILAQIYRADIRGLVAGIRIPVLLIHGELDALAPPAFGRDLASRIHGARVEIIPGAGHCPHITYPDVVAARIEDFLHLQGISASRAAGG